MRHVRKHRPRKKISSLIWLFFLSYKNRQINYYNYHSIVTEVCDHSSVTVVAGDLTINTFKVLISFIAEPVLERKNKKLCFPFLQKTLYMCDYYYISEPIGCMSTQNLSTG